MARTEINPFGNAVFESILKKFGLSFYDFEIAPVGSGYIHYTFVLKGKESFILQRVNKLVFQQPEIIASNLHAAAAHLRMRYPGYLFLTPLTTINGQQLAYDADGFPWRMFPYFDNTYTIDSVDDAAQAYSAAAEFAKLVHHLDDVDVTLFRPTIDRFHDLQWRFEQFEESLVGGVRERIAACEDDIKHAKAYHHLVDHYVRLTSGNELKLRITHNDTKINNILFEARTRQALCAIDLDTLMPGYVMYDVGDMIRTFVSPVDEEEKDLDKVVVRLDIYKAVITGYLDQMGEKLSNAEREAIPFSGMMMTYIMALRMLTDHLNGDVYYNIRYPGQNLVRARNQLRLLDQLQEL